MTKKNVRVLLAPAEFRETQRVLMDDGVYFIAGSSSLSIPATHTTYIDQSSTRLWDMGDNVEAVTPGEAARYELAAHLGDIRRVGWSRNDITLFDHRVPLYFSGPGRSEEYVLVDLVGAYHQIYRLLWLDVSYPRALGGRYYMAGVAGALESWKAARNAVVGISRSREMTAYRGYNRYSITTTNRYLSPAFWATICSLLCWVATEAIAYGAVYINTDGYIFPSERMADEFMLFLLRYDWLFTVRARGPGEIRGWNSYKVGAKETHHYKLGLPIGGKEFTSVNLADAEKWSRYWLRLRRYGTG